MRPKLSLHVTLKKKSKPVFLVWLVEHLLKVPEVWISMESQNLQYEQWSETQLKDDGKKE